MTDQPDDPTPLPQPAAALTVVPAGPAALTRAPVLPGPNPAVAYLASLAPGSRPAAESVLRALAGWLRGQDRPATREEVAALPWWELRHAHVQALRSKLVTAYAPRSVNRALSILRGVLNMAWKNDQMTTDAFQKAASVKGVEKDDTKAGRALEPGEVEALMQACAERPEEDGLRDAAIIAVMYAAGLRRAEIAGLDVAAFDPTTSALVVVGKRNKRRTVYVAPGWVDHLQTWLARRGAEPGPLFPRRRGGNERLTPAGVRHIIDTVREHAGVAPFTPHDLRRSFGSKMLEEGADLSMVQKLMGHTDVRTTTIYDRRGEKAKKQAVQRMAKKTSAPALTQERLQQVEASYPLTTVFHVDESLGSPRVDVSLLQAEVYGGRVTVEQILLPAAPTDALTLAPFSGRTDEHRHLCAQAARWLERQGWTWGLTRATLTYAGGIADVAAPSARVYVECGYTQGEKVLRALVADERVLVVPYLGTVPTVGFLFTRRAPLRWKP